MRLLGGSIWLLSGVLLMGSPAWAATSGSGSTGDTGVSEEEPLIARGGGGCGEGLAWMVVALPLAVVLLRRSAP